MLSRVLRKKRTEMMTTEAEIQKAILDWLKANQYCHWRNYVGPIVRGHSKKFSPNPMAGLPDIMGFSKMRPGVLFGCEVKTSTGKLSDKQIIWINRITEAGAYAFVARSLEDFVEQIGLIESPSNFKLKST